MEMYRFKTHFMSCAEEGGERPRGGNEDRDRGNMVNKIVIQLEPKVIICIALIIPY